MSNFELLRSNASTLKAHSHVTALITATGKCYTVLDCEFDQVLSQMEQEGDPVVSEILTLADDCLDIPSYKTRTSLLQASPLNANAQIWGLFSDGIHTRPLSSTF